MIRVFLIDPDAASSAFMTAGLLGNEVIQLVGSQADADGPLLLLYDAKPDIVLIHVDKKLGVDSTRVVSLRAQLPNMATLLYGGESSSIEAMAGLLDGTDDFVYRNDRPPEEFRDEIILRTRMLFPDRGGTMDSIAHWNQWENRPAPPTPLRRAEPRLVVIAGSTGCPSPLRAMLQALPPEFSTPIACVVHMLPPFIEIFAERLNRGLDREVRIAVSGQALDPSTVTVAPGDRHLEVRLHDGRPMFVTHDGPAENFVRPSADALFRSAAASMGGETMAVVLSGMGCDGLIGTGYIRAQGGHVMVQDRDSSVVWGMPGTIAEAGLANEIVAAQSLAARLRYHCPPLLVEKSHIATG